jgi:sialidase-1
MIRISIATAAFMFVLTGVPTLQGAEPDRQQPLKLAPEIRERCLTILTEAVKLDDFWPGIHAAEALTLAGRGADVVAALGEQLPKEKDDQRRCGLARELARAGDRNRLPTLYEILADEKSTGRVHAAECLYKLGEVGDGKALRAALSKENTPLSLFAAAALAKSGDQEALARVREQLKSDDAANRTLAAFALVQVCTADDVEPLLKMLATEKDPSGQAFAASALASLGNAKGREALGRGLDSTDAGVRAIAADFVGHSRSIEFQPKLIKLLDDPALDVRIRAAQSLLVLSQPAARTGQTKPKQVSEK